MPKVASPLCWLVFTGAFVSLLAASCGSNSNSPKAWGATPQSIDTFDTGDALGPQIALNTAGDGLMVWQQLEGTSYSNWASRYTAGAGWDTPVRIDSGPTGNPWAAHVAVDSGGNGVAVWAHETLTPTFEIWANNYTAGTGWDAAATLATGLPDSPSTELPVPQPVLDANGNGMAVWYKQLSSDHEIWASRYSSGTWVTPVMVDFMTPTPGSIPRVAMNPAGNAQIVCANSVGVGAYRYSAGSWSTGIVQVNTNISSHPQIVVDAGGNGLAVWQEDPWSGINDVWANRYTAGSGWGTAEKIENDTGTATEPKIAIDADGNGLAVWQQNDGTRDNIWANRYDAVTGWGTAEMIETDDTGGATKPQIALDAHGNGLAVWQQSDGTRDNIWANRYISGTGWGTAELIETDDSGTALDPRVALDAAGNGLAVWSQHDGTHWNVVANRFQ